MQYKLQKVNLTRNQKQKLIRAAKKKAQINLRLTYAQLQNGNQPLNLTERQIQKIRKASAARRGATLNISPRQIKSGGFLPLLLPLLGALGGLAGGAASIAKAVNEDKSSKAMLEEQKRHNLALEGKGFKKTRGGSKGKGLYLKPHQKTGKGMYLKPPKIGKGNKFFAAPKRSYLTKKKLLNCR